MDMPLNAFKSNLQSGEMQYGLWSFLCSPIVAEIVCDAGFDWVLLDTEHAPNELPDVVDFLRASTARAASPVVRPAWNDPVIMKRLLDVGVQSFVVPFVQNADEARAAVAATRYPPEGIRGVMGSGRASNYGRVDNYLKTASEQIAVVVQVETIEALHNVEEIASVPGVDGLFIGPSDLAASMGHLGDVSHEDVQNKIQEAVAKITSLGKPVGTIASDPEMVKKYRDWGCTFIAAGLDHRILASGCSSVLDAIRSS